MPSIWNHTPPGDGLLEYYGWVRSVDGPTLTDFFNKMALFGDIGYQDRLCVSGTAVSASFSLTFLERGPEGDEPTIWVTFDVGNVNGGTATVHRHSYAPRPPREVGESFQALTVRWLCGAYSSLLEFNDEFNSPFNFSASCPVSVPASESAPGVAPGHLIESLGTALLRWEPPDSAIKPWGSEEGTNSLDGDGYSLEVGVGAWPVAALTPADPLPESVAIGFQASYSTFDGAATLTGTGLTVVIGQTTVTVNGTTAALPFIIERRASMGVILHASDQTLAVNGEFIAIDLSSVPPSVPPDLEFGPFNGRLQRVVVYDAISPTDALTVTSNWKS